MSGGKSRFIPMAAVAWAKANPGKRGVIFTGTEQSAERHRKLLAEENGGARPFNVRVKRQ
jgi:hypothetical protein